MIGGSAVYRVRLPTPLGIRFEEVEQGQAEGVVVAELIETGSAYADGRVLVGDKLVTCSAVTFGGQGALVTVGAGRQFTSWQRELSAPGGFEPTQRKARRSCSPLHALSLVAPHPTRATVPCGKLDFDTIMAALGSNSGRFGYVDIVLELQHTDASVPRAAGRRTRPVDESNVEWDAAGGTMVDGKSTPIRPGKDNF